MSCKISLIVPVFNCEKYISECLDSVLSQFPSNYELILIEDGSDDSTPEILKSYDRKNLRVFYCQHKGASAARNRVMLNGSCELWTVPDKNFDSASDFADEYINESHSEKTDFLIFNFSVAVIKSLGENVPADYASHKTTEDERADFIAFNRPRQSGHKLSCERRQSPHLRRLKIKRRSY